MVKDILRQIDENGIKTKLLPIEYLAQIKSDILRLKETANLNGFQKWIVNERYILDVPELPFTPKTIVIAAIKFNLVNVIFNSAGKSVTDIFFTENDIKNYISTLFTQNGYNIKYIHWLPQKRLAVCSGLAEYGRNNIAYIDGWGSLFEIRTFITDMPCEGNYVWRNACRMDVCDRCKACIRNCPTKAIKDDKFLIDNEICLTKFVESEEPYPDWIPKSVHHSVFGCNRCQDVCPRNKKALSNISETIYFDEEETGLLLDGAKRENIPQNILGKVERLGIEDWRLKCMPKNLKALFANNTD